MSKSSCKYFKTCGGDSCLKCNGYEKIKKENKFLYGWKLYVCYDGKWEYETFEETRKMFLENKKAYQENCQYPQRWSRGRELNPSYKKEEVKK